MSKELTRFDEIRDLLTSTEDLDQIRTIRDRAEAVRAYAKSARLGLKLQNQAAAIKLEAERKAGAQLARLRLRGGDRKSRGRKDVVSLRGLGITKSQSARWQLEASVPKPLFEEYLSQANMENRAVTSADLIRLARSMLQSRRHGRRKVRPERLPRRSTTRPSEVRSVVDELRSHRALLADILSCSRDRHELKRGEVKGISYILGEMELLLDDLACLVDGSGPSTADS